MSETLKNAVPAVNDVETAKALGWFSIGLGVAELLAAGPISRALGLGHRSLIRAFGTREIAAGVGILTTPDAASQVWTRVAGDALDLWLLQSALRPSNPRRGAAVAATAFVAGVTLVDVLCAAALSGRAARALATAQRIRVAPRPQPLPRSQGQRQMLSAGR